MSSNTDRSSYRNTFKNQTSYSTAGSQSLNKSLLNEEPVVSKRVSYSYSSSSGGGGGGGNYFGTILRACLLKSDK